MRNNLKLLHIEDNLAHASLLRRHVEQLYPEVEIIHLPDGEQALAYIEANRQALESRHLLLLDMHLPKVDGLEILTHVRKIRELAQLPVVILTTSNAPGDINLSYQYGADAYLVKPLENNELKAMVEGLCDFWLKWNVA